MVLWPCFENKHVNRLLGPCEYRRRAMSGQYAGTLSSCVSYMPAHTIILLVFEELCRADRRVCVCVYLGVFVCGIVICT